MSTSKRSVQAKPRRARRNKSNGRSPLFAQAAASVESSAGSSSVTVPRNNQMFPDLFRTAGSQSLLIPYGPGTSGTYTYKANGVYFNGPQTNYTGAFAQNVPAGMSYLLSSPGSTASGSDAPYGYVTVRRAEVSVRVTTTAGNPVGATVGISFHNQPSMALYTTTNYREQPMTAWADIPVSTTAGAIVVSNSADIHNVLGVSRQVYDNDEDYWAAATADPARLCYYTVWARVHDGTSLGLLSLDVFTTYHYTFRVRNGFSTDAPA